ncbi:nucleotidyl transferase AbiEii/AbiGii toxin family protein [Streptomyces sp. PLM4]|uniref:nucleotidyl transferase AbiEii/AbiGii toxin family protein n=1 Tax=Streptomyces sp. PLM4 TaxID=2929798 RepID=UPI00205E67B0|nr:nucleotidyl transferase AbiEii/AbiGii toxin family protein [Streptomyces sp. PLM4]BDH69420.1 hypothetical protein MTP06_28690 [Streptomyces sp. PLM4]
MQTATPFRSWPPGDNSPGLTTPDEHVLWAVGVVLGAAKAVLPTDGWHLKGSAALLGWAGPGARIPEDVDLALAESVAGALLATGALPSPAPGTHVTVLRSERMTFRLAGRPPVHRALTRVEAAGATVDVPLNLALIPDPTAYADRRTGLLAFPGGPEPAGVPAATYGRCLAQKLLRYTLPRSGGRRATRWTDLLDFLLCAESSRAPRLGLWSLRADIAAELAVVERDWPSLPAPPAEWLDFWDAAMFRYGYSCGRLHEAVAKAEAFWGPVLADGPSGEDVAAGPAWDPGSWAWGATPPIP